MYKTLQISVEPTEYDKSYCWRASGKLHYLPKSQCEFKGDVLTIPDWLYNKKQELFNYLAMKGKLKTL